MEGNGQAKQVEAKCGIGFSQNRAMSAASSALKQLKWSQNQGPLPPRITQRRYHKPPLRGGQEHTTHIQYALVLTESCAYLRSSCELIKRQVQH